MAVSAIESAALEPYEGGEAFGATGAYEVVRARLRYRVDPVADHAARERIVDFDRACPDDQGLIALEGDLVVLRPVDAARGNHTLLYSVANRGSVTMPMSVGATALPGLSDRVVPGDAWPLRRGYTLAWSGWQWDVVRRAGMIGLAVPDALGDDGRPLAGDVRVRFQVPERLDTARLGGLALDPANAPPLPYPPEGLDQPDARLTVRDRPDEDPTPIGRARWRFVDDDRIALDTGFEAGRIYDVTYRTARCPVVGAGLVAVRDAVSWLRYAPDAEGNPVGGHVERVLATGSSQSGRFLRQFLFEGMNADDRGRRVFDGVHVHIAGGRRGEFNARYGQPGVIWRGPGDVPPFATNDLLDRARETGTVPKVVSTNSAAEYWRGDAWLAHGDGAARADVDDSAEVRHYLLAGADHIGRLAELAGAMFPHVNEPNALDAVPAERAVFAALDAWVCDHVEPPPSRVPRLDDATAVDRAAALAAFARRADVSTPDADSLPAGRDGAATAIVSALDADGNEVAGIRLPQVSVPVAAYTGWNVRPPMAGRPDLMPDFIGSRVALPPPAAAERYAGRSAYETAVRADAGQLVAARHLLADDVELVVADALRAYDQTVKGS
ncbi:MAG TPA: alpha/beta hydrolase domain-containing protein [Acidimicrobiia bacterium]